MEIGSDSRRAACHPISPPSLRLFSPLRCSRSTSSLLSSPLRCSRATFFLLSSQMLSLSTSLSFSLSLSLSLSPSLLLLHTAIPQSNSLLTSATCLNRQPLPTQHTHTHIHTHTKKWP